MIIQIDHVAMSSMNFERHIKTINSVSYKQEFMARNVKNLRIKRSLMRQFCEDHDLALLTSKGNVAIELINHRHINMTDSYIVPIFENVPGGLTDERGRKSINDRVFMEATIKSFDVPIYVKRDVSKNGFRFNKMVVRVTGREKSVAFWECLGFRLVQTKKGFALLEFESVLTADVCQIYLQERKTADGLPYLDDCGFNCIAFISGSAENERKLLDGKGFETTEIEVLTLNRRVLNIFFARGFCGELVEIIEVRR